MQISFSELLKRYLDLIGVDGAERVFTRIEPAQAQLAGSISDFQATGSPFPEGLPVPNGAPPRLVEHGGPMGPQPTDANALAQFLQLQAQSALGSGQEG